MKIKTIIWIYFIVMSSCIFALDQRLDNDWKKKISDEYPKIYHSHQISIGEIEQYLEKVNSNIQGSPNESVNYYIKSYLLRVKIGNYINNDNVNKGYTINDYRATSKMLNEVKEEQELLAKVLLLNSQADDSEKLAYSLLTEIVSNSQSLILKEKAIKSRVSLTSLADLAGCPVFIEDTDSTYECSPIAHSWPEYLYEEYSSIYALYGSVVDEENMLRIKKEFSERLQKNEYGVVDSKLSQYVLDQFSNQESDYWEKYNAGELDSMAVKYEEIPKAYKSVPFYWLETIIANNLQEYAEWDIRGMSPPSGKLETNTDNTTPIEPKLNAEKKSISFENTESLRSQQVNDEVINESNSLIRALSIIGLLVVFLALKTKLGVKSFNH